MLRRAFITSTRRAVSGSQFTVTQRFYSKPFFFTQDHEWAQETDSLVRTGISDVAQNKLGEIIHLEFQVEVRSHVLRTVENPFFTHHFYNV